MKIAVCPGSFDPITLGHLDIISRRPSSLTGSLFWYRSNPAKTNYAFTIAERVDFIKRVTADLPNVCVDSSDGLLADYLREKGACAIVKGLRAVSDFEYEFQMSLANKMLNPQAETVFFTAAAENMYLSSSIVKQIASFGGDISNFVPACILGEIQARLSRK